VWREMKRSDALLAYLLEQEGLRLEEADSIAYGESQPSRRLEGVLALAPFEWKRGVLLLLLTYRYQSLGRVKRILGYSRTYTQRLNKNFLRNLLLKWADKFFLQRNHCILCDEWVELPKGDEHFEKYQHLLLVHFRNLLSTPQKKIVHLIYFHEMNKIKTPS